ncbi:MAG: DUF4097 domain-containing protein [Bacteroidota bacterium]|nr:DUF4097 domain-containing protein [Bacteroidota bacterium]
MIYNSIDRCIHLSLVLAFVCTVQAQNKIQVVTKIIERTLEVNKGDVLRISAEKATISVKRWEGDHISLKLQLIAKHPDRSVAERELDHLRYVVEKNGYIHDLGNYFSITKSTDPIRANLKAVYELQIPSDLHLTINAKYADVSLVNTTGRSIVDLEFGRLTLQGVSGEMDVRTLYSDVIGNTLDLALDVKADNTDIQLTRALGSYRIGSSYGHIHIDAAGQLKKVNITAVRTDVTIVARDFWEHDYDINTTYSEIVLPHEWSQQIRTGAAGRVSFEHLTDKRKPIIRVSTSNSPVTIRQGSPNSTQH